MFYLIVRFLAKVLFKVLFRLEAVGLKNIPLKGGFILASNHVSYLDPPAVGVACPRVLWFLAKEELFRNVLFAWLIANSNSIPIKGESGDLGSLRRAIRELEAGGALTIFPEGGRTVDGQLVEPMRGIGLLATKTGVPIIPAFIEGSDKALPIHARFIRPKKIRVYFGRPILPEKMNSQINRDDFYQAIAGRTMKEIERLKNRSSQFC